MALIKVTIVIEGQVEALAVTMSDADTLESKLDDIIQKSNGLLKGKPTFYLKRMSPKKTLSDYGIKNGDIIFAVLQSEMDRNAQVTVVPAPNLDDDDGINRHNAG